MKFSNVIYNIGPYERPGAIRLSYIVLVKSEFGL